MPCSPAVFGLPRTQKKELLMRRVSCIHIKNFRSCRNVALPLEGYTPLIGQNNTGKSTILQAIERVLQPKTLSAADFSVPDVPIEVAARIEGTGHCVRRHTRLAIQSAGIPDTAGH